MTGAAQLWPPFVAMCRLSDAPLVASRVDPGSSYLLNLLEK